MNKQAISKILSLLVALCLMLGMLPVTAAAAGTATGYITIGTSSLQNLTAGINGTGWAWDASTDTLTLDSDYTGHYIYINCQATDTVNLVYTGNVEVNPTGTSRANAIGCDGSLNITGTGADSLALHNDENTLLVAGNLTISGGTLTATSTSDNSDAICSSGGDILIENGADVTATATGEASAGIRAKGNITIAGSVVNATGDNHGISGRSVSITGGTVTVETTTTFDYAPAYAIWGRDGITIGGDADVTATTASGSNGFGLNANYGTIDISTTGTVTATGNGGVNALNAEGAVNISNGTVKLYHADSHFIYGTLNKTGGSLYYNDVLQDDSPATPTGWDLTSGVLTIYTDAGMTDWIANGWDTYTGNTNCAAVTSVVIENGVTAIGRFAFDGCTNLASVAIPSSVTSIGDGAFWDCTSLAAIAIPNGVTSIGNQTFIGCTSLAAIVIPDGVTSFSGTFRDCTSLTTVTIGSGLVTIGEGSFSGCTSLAAIAIPNNVSTIGDGAFSNCTSLATVTLGSGLTIIGEGSFTDCASLVSVTIPSSVTLIKHKAFSGCTGLTDVTFLGKTPPVLEDNAFKTMGGAITVTVPYGSKGAYEAAFTDHLPLDLLPAGSTIVEAGAPLPSPNNSGSGSGSGGGRGAGTDYTNNAPQPLSTTEAVNAVNAAIKNAEGSVRVKNASDVSLDTFKAMAKAAGKTPLKLNADSMSADGKSVDVRITLDPAKSSGPLNLSASTTSERAKSTEAFFEKHHNNNVSVVSLGQQGSFGQPVEIAAKIDPALDTTKLVFYAYDQASNTYKRIENPAYWADKNGYVHFTTELGGDIVISDGPLEKK